MLIEPPGQLPGAVSEVVKRLVLLLREHAQISGKKEMV
jgi:hypothetical protein